MSHPKTILITGATTGIGRHAALHFARRGYRVFATGRKESALARLAADAAGTPLETLHLDVTDEKSIAVARAAVEERTAGRGLDVLVNNAGYGLPGPLELVSDADLRAQFETNVFGLMAVTREFLPLLRASGAARIINVSSVGGRVTFPLFGAYHASKYAVEALSDALRLELLPFGIQVAVIEPGPIKTEFSERSMGLVDAQKNAFASTVYAPVMARAEEIQRYADKQSVGPEVVTRAIEKAITSRRAAARYVAPFFPRVMLWAMAILPTRWSDAIMRRAIGMTRERLATRPAGAPAAAAREAA